MTITIQDKHTEDLIKRIGQRTGEGPGAVVRRLAEKEIGDQAVPFTMEERAVRLEAIRRFTRRYAPDPAPSSDEVRREIDEINMIE